ncbi:MAG: DNA photolyase [Desulfobacteraceae bacterium]|nr:DNA photolyase [Desulfobacteraceae bacterium]
MKIKKLFADKETEYSEETKLIQKRTDLDLEIVVNENQIFDYINSSDDPIQKGKTCLYITQNRGAIIKDCPGTSYYTCCDYTILHTGTFCTMDCSYCILQAYFHPPLLRYFVGKDKISESLDNVFSQDKIFRIGTGEYTDSLIWEEISDQPSFLVKKFANQNNSILELKTKTVNIDSLQSIDHNEKTVIAWSLNTERIIKSEERNTSSLKARLKAAKKCESWGYKLAFHFDPVVIYDGCIDEYKKVIKTIFDYVSPKNILWISIGSFRFMPHLKPLIEKRFPDSTICYGEFILGLDNKMRYFKPLRIQTYKGIIDQIKKYAPEVTAYFCMEDRKVWEECFGFFPKEEGALGKILDQSAIDHCKLKPVP